MAARKTLVDASVLIAAAVEDHEHHEPALAWYNEEVEADTRLFITAHALAEVYSGLTGWKFAGRYLTGAQVSRIIDDFLDDMEAVIEIVSWDYFDAIEAGIKNNIRGATIYDAVHAEAARGARIGRIATLNRKHYERVWDGELPEIL